MDRRLVLHKNRKYLVGTSLEAESSQKRHCRGLNIPGGEGPDMVLRKGHTSETKVGPQRYRSKCIEFDAPISHDGIVQGGSGSVN